MGNAVAAPTERFRDAVPPRWRAAAAGQVGRSYRLLEKIGGSRPSQPGALEELLYDVDEGSAFRGGPCGGIEMGRAGSSESERQVSGALPALLCARFHARDGGMAGATDSRAGK